MKLVDVDGVRIMTPEQLADRTRALPEPLVRALIACQIQTWPGGTWTNRTYEVIRASDGQWLVDFGDGAIEPRRDWSAVVDWLCRLGARDVELLEWDL